MNDELLSFDEFDQCSIWVFYERYHWSCWAEFEWFIRDCDLVFSHVGYRLLHVFDFEGDVVEQSVFVVWLDELLLFLVEREFKLGSFFIRVLKKSDFSVVLGYFMSADEFKAYQPGVEVDRRVHVTRSDARVGKHHVPHRSLISAAQVYRGYGDVACSGDAKGTRLIAYCDDVYSRC